MISNTLHRLHRTRHTGIAAGSLGAALDERATSFRFGERIEVCYLAVGNDAASMDAHLSRQHRSMPWDREWACDPNKMDAVKIIVFAYRNALDEAMSAYSRLGQPSVEVMEADLAFLLNDINQIVIGHENQNLLDVIGFRMGLVHRSMRHLRFDEVMNLLKSPDRAKDACWLLNQRDQLYGRKTMIKIEDVPWSVPVAEWDVAPCKAFHRDGHAIVREDGWKALTLDDFWHRYCNHLKDDDAALLRLWKSQLKLAARRAEIRGRKPARDGTEDVNGVDFSPEQARRPVASRLK